MRNTKVFLLSILALIFLAFTFIFSWWFIAGAVIIMLINQRELMKPKNNSKK